jgi:PST family polysaccharide transporter
MAFAWSRAVDQFVAGCVQFAAAPRRYRPGLTRSALSVVFRFGIPLAGANFVSYILLNDYAFVDHSLAPSRSVCMCWLSLWHPGRTAFWAQ